MVYYINIDKKPTMKDYTIKTQTTTEMAGGVLEGCPLYEVTKTQYNIFQDGMLVGFTFDKDEIETVIKGIETNAWANVGNRFD